MPSENVEVVRHLVEANRSGDLESAIETALALTDPRIEFQSVMAAVKPETYRGHRAMVCSMCEGKVLRARVYPSREQALDAVGPNDATEGK
jgi:hypothetical protein